MKIALDTNAYTDLARGHAPIAQLAATAAEVFLPFIVLAELRAGFAVGTKTASNEREFELFLTKPNVKVVYADPTTILHYIEIYRHLRLAGKMIPTNDLWIAALALQHNATLVSRDAHFSHVPGLSLA